VFHVFAEGPLVAPILTASANVVLAQTSTSSPAATGHPCGARNADGLMVGPMGIMGMGMMQLAQAQTYE